jgi:4-methylaminobutanoate oxidase (formaldehyde-forming)
VKYYYRLRFPHDEHELARPHRTSPIHYRLLEHGAVFGEKFGWERVNYFQPGKESRRMGEDHASGVGEAASLTVWVGTQATRGASLVDLTSFGIEISGAGALKLCNGFGQQRGKLRQRDLHSIPERERRHSI